MEWFLINERSTECECVCFVMATNTGRSVEPIYWRFAAFSLSQMVPCHILSIINSWFVEETKRKLKNLKSQKICLKIRWDNLYNKFLVWVLCVSEYILEDSVYGGWKHCYKLFIHWRIANKSGIQTRVCIVSSLSSSTECHCCLRGDSRGKWRRHCESIDSFRCDFASIISI